MSSGIYCMFFPSLDDKYYIGLSNSIETRKQQHYTKLVGGSHSNPKLLSAYNIYGLPEFHIIEECATEKLSEREIYWINQFDSYRNGFNSTGGGQHAFGEGHPQALHSKDTYIKVLLEISSTNRSLKDISIDNNIGYDTVRDMACGRSHTYLKDQYPTEYANMLSKSGTRSSMMYNPNKYVNILHLIADSALTLKEVSIRTGVSYSIVRNIAYGSSHKYLEKDFPEKYTIMRCKIRVNKGGKWETL